MSFNNPTPQFGTAEYVGSPGGDHCRYCHQLIAGSYYRINDGMPCPACAEKARCELAKDSHAAYLRALLLGIGAAVVGLILYATFVIATGLVIGYVSLAVGWMVGKAMIKGSNGIGGRRYQITAVLLTYAAVSMAAVPIWINYARQYQEKQRLEAEPPQSASESGRRAPLPPPRPVQPRPAPGGWLVRITLLGFASPFVVLWERGPSYGSMIGLLILFVGMRFAWQITAGRPLEIYGPFENAPQPAG
jgi:hypothetical protein